MKITHTITQKYQGDISLIKGVEAPKDAKFKPLKKELIVALGEITGHRHRILPSVKECEISYAEYLDSWYLKIDKGDAVIKHEEHAPITLSPGVYFVGKQYEFDEREEYKQVLD